MSKTVLSDQRLAAYYCASQQGRGGREGARRGIDCTRGTEGLHYVNYICKTYYHYYSSAGENKRVAMVPTDSRYEAKKSAVRKMSKTDRKQRNASVK